MSKRITILILCLVISLGFISYVFAEQGFIIFFARPDWMDVTTGEIADQPFIYDLEYLGYDVQVEYNDNMANATQDYIDMLNEADLIILGRSMPSTTAQPPHKEVWNALTAPLMQLSPWSCRISRMNWFNSETCTHYNENEVFYVTVEEPDDPVFEGIELDGDECAWAVGVMDVISIDDAGNGFVLARSPEDYSVQFVRFEPDVEFYPGSVDMPAGHRTFIGNGNDNLRDADNNAIINFWNWTEQSLQVYHNEIARMIAISTGGGSGVESEKAELVKFKLSQNYPNPFNPTTNIDFTLGKSGHTTVQIFNMVGQLVETLVNEELSAGLHHISFNAQHLNSGVYLYKIQSGEFTETKKMILMQ